MACCRKFSISVKLRIIPLHIWQYQWQKSPSCATSQAPARWTAKSSRRNQRRHRRRRRTPPPKGKAVAAKREDRRASEGCVLAKNEGDFAAIVALCCETDFVAKNAGFVELTQKLLDAAIAARIRTLDELKEMTIDGRKLPTSSPTRAVKQARR